MDADEQEVCDFLKSCPGEFVAAREIARRAGGKWRFREDPHWAKPILIRLVEKGVLESDSTGHYRLRPPEKKKKERWISAETQEAIERAGQEFAEGKTIDDPESP